MTDLGSVTAVIPQWNRAQLLSEVLKHLAAQTYPIHRTIVVDNGSTDDSAAVAEAAGAEVLRLGRNLGFAAAVNRGIQAARTDWVAILNNDVTLAPDWLAELVTAASRSGAWFATGKLLRHDDADVIDGTFDLLSAGGTAWRCGSGRVDGPLWSETRSIQFAPLTAAVFRRETFERVGLLDERFESYLEDIDLGLRCSTAALEGVYVPTARGRHQGSATRGAWHKATVRLIARNQIFLIAKHFQGAPKWRILAAQLLWGLVAARHFSALAYLAGKWQGLVRFRELQAGGNAWAMVSSAVERSECDLYRYQQRSGFDAYWRWYFMLTRRSAE